MTKVQNKFCKQYHILDISFILRGNHFCKRNSWTLVRSLHMSIKCYTCYFPKPWKHNLACNFCRNMYIPLSFIRISSFNSCTFSTLLDKQVPNLMNYFNNATPEQFKHKVWSVLSKKLLTALLWLLFTFFIYSVKTFIFFVWII